MGLFSLLKDKIAAGGASVALEEVSAPAIRAKSAFFQTAGLPGKRARFEELNNDSEKEVETSTLTVRSSAKSFTAGARQPIAPDASQLVDAREKEGPSPKDVEYMSISQFQQVVELYRGSISTVYRATCSMTKSLVIIKAYQKSKMKEKNFLRMEREIRLMRLLEGDVAIVQLYNVFEDSSFKYLVMETCKGGDLFKAMLLRGGKMDEHWVCHEMVAPLLRVLVRLHARHILHRDIKPENIFLTSSQRFKLGDLGLAIQSDLELPFTRSGTLDYLSPEVLANPTCELQESPKVTKGDLKQKGVRPYDEKVDCWAAGVLAYELVVGRPPFEVKDEAKTASAIMYKNDFPLPSKYSTQWADFVKQALQKNPAMRSTAAQLLDHPWVLLHVRAPVLAEAPLPELDLPALSLSKHKLKHSQTMGAGVAAPRTEAAPKAEGAADSRRESARVRPAGPAREPGVSWADSRTGSGHLSPSPLGKQSGDTAVTDGSETVSVVSVLNLSNTSEQQLVGTPVLASTMLKSTGTPRQHSNLAPQGLPSHISNSSLQLEASGGSFTAMLAKAPTGSAGYIDSGDVLEDEHERRAGGMRLRMKHYFKRQA